ncbi:MAG TPA: TIGR02996 domain-containing protein, partial [Gemmataceae bacterium]|nr:TIGR02996 domain-containing protein [Gemmataceae bacterium]
MSEERVFLQAIREDPEDDSVRLIYADWLEEQGHAARAELIRVQCTLAGMLAGDPRRVALEDHERTLLRTHKDV